MYGESPSSVADFRVVKLENRENSPGIRPLRITHVATVGAGTMPKQNVRLNVRLNLLNRETPLDLYAYPDLA